MAVAANTMRTTSAAWVKRIRANRLAARVWGTSPPAAIGLSWEPGERGIDRRRHAWALPVARRSYLENLLHEKVMRAAVDASRIRPNSPEPHEQQLIGLGGVEPVARHQCRIAHLQHRLRSVAGEELSRAIVVCVQATHLDRVSASDEEAGDHNQAGQFHC